ncbi:MAG: acyl--CoA ligase, partial [Alphaproteobacteria bacterium]|nr:acyl--CoA ligase [Alphaproteobacteria bacterium]
MNLAAHLLRNAKRDPAGPALGRGDAVVADWAGMAVQVAQLAGGLRGLGYAAGTRIAIVAANSTDYAVAIYAIWWAGYAAVPVNVKLHPKELAYCLDHSQAALVFHSRDMGENVAASGSSARMVEIGGGDWGKLFADPVDLAPAAPHDLLWLVYTSGPTGGPKGAMITPRKAPAGATSYFARIDTPETGDCFVQRGPTA